MLRVLEAVDWLLALAAVAIGILHTALVYKLFPQLGGGSFLFVGTGLAFIYLGLFNVVRVASPARATLLILCLVSNVSAAVYGCVFYKHVDTLHLGIVLGLVALALLAAVDLRRLKQS